MKKSVAGRASSANKRRPYHAALAPLLLGLGLLAASGAVGCASKPTLEIRTAQVSGVSPLGVGLNVQIQVNNKNSFDVQVRDVRAQVTVAEKFALAPIQMNPNVWLPAKQSTSISVPVTIPWTVLPGVLAATLGSKSVPYRVTGTADVTATRLLGIQRNDEPLDESGEIPRATVLSAARTMLPNVY